MKIILIAITALMLNIQSARSEAPCPDANYFENILKHFCWSCTLPFNLAGFGDNVPAGANTKAFCSCSDELGVPEFGVSFGYWSPDHLIEVGTIPFCSPTLGGLLMQDDITMMGAPAAKSGVGVSAVNTAALHYNYMINPLFKMLGIFLLPDCDKNAGYVDLDIAYLSILDPTFYDSVLAYLFTPDAIPIANPAGRAICIGDGLRVSLSGGAVEDLWFCAGFNGHLYPLTGFIAAGSTNFIRNTELITTRALASLHRRGLSQTTYGREAMCRTKYDPMMPKAQYKISMTYPSPEASPAVAEASQPTVSPQDPTRNSRNGAEVGEVYNDKLTGSWGECCHPLGWPSMWWGSGRSAAGGGKDMHAVYNIFRYTDCCIRIR